MHRVVEEGDPAGVGGNPLAQHRGGDCRHVLATEGGRGGGSRCEVPAWVQAPARQREGGMGSPPPLAGGKARQPRQRRPAPPADLAPRRRLEQLVGPVGGVGNAVHVVGCVDDAPRRGDRHWPKVLATDDGDILRDYRKRSGSSGVRVGSPRPEESRPTDCSGAKHSLCRPARVLGGEAELMDPQRLHPSGRRWEQPAWPAGALTIRPPNALAMVVVGCVIDQKRTISGRRTQVGLWYSWRMGVGGRMRRVTTGQGCTALGPPAQPLCNPSPWCPQAPIPSHLVLISSDVQHRLPLRHDIVWQRDGDGLARQRVQADALPEGAHGGAIDLLPGEREGGVDVGRQAGSQWAPAEASGCSSASALRRGSPATAPPRTVLVTGPAMGCVPAAGSPGK